MATTSGPGNALIDDLVAVLFTDGSTLPNGTTGCEWTSPTRIELRPKDFGGLSSRPRGAPSGRVPLPPLAIRVNWVECIMPSIGSIPDGRRYHP